MENAMLKRNWMQKIANSVFLLIFHFLYKYYWEVQVYDRFLYRSGNITYQDGNLQSNK